MRRLLPYAQLVRLPNTFTVWADILLGALVTGLFLSHWPLLLCLLAASTCLYWSGMVWNDYVDVDEDRKDRPGRPLPSGRVSLSSARTLAAGLMLVGCAMALLAGIRSTEGAWEFDWRPLIVAGQLVLAILLYNGVLSGRGAVFSIVFCIFVLAGLSVLFLVDSQYVQSRFVLAAVFAFLQLAAYLIASFMSDAPFRATFAGPIFMGLCRFLNILLGLSILSSTIPFWGWLIALIVGIYIAGVTWFARDEAIESSKQTLIGATIVIAVAFLFTLMVPAIAIEADIRFNTSVLFPYALALFGAYLGYAILRAIRRPSPGHVQAVIKRAILGLIVVDALLASAFIDTWGLLLLLLVFPGMLLGRWLYST